MSDSKSKFREAIEIIGALTAILGLPIFLYERGERREQRYLDCRKELAVYPTDLRTNLVEVTRALALYQVGAATSLQTKSALSGGLTQIQRAKGLVESYKCELPDLKMLEGSISELLETIVDGENISSRLLDAYEKSINLAVFRQTYADDCCPRLDKWLTWWFY